MRRKLGERCTCPSCAGVLYTHHPLDPRFLEPGQHDSYALAVSAISSFTKEPQTFGQLHAQQFWREWLKSKEYESLRRPDLKDAAPLTKPLNIFSGLFFQNHLPSRILQFRWRVLGSMEQGRTLIEPDGIVILLNPTHPRHKHSPTNVLRTLLHEMCHAFLGQYSCYDGASCNTGQCKQLCRQNYGITGHGRAWQLLAKAIESEAPGLLPGLSVRLGRREMALQEIERGGFWPSECDLRSLCREFEVVARVWMKKVVRDDDDDVMDRMLDRWGGRARPKPGRRRRSMGCLRSEQ